MQNRRIRFLGFSAAAVLLAGCAKTPDQAVVREKGDSGIAQYQEADTQETAAGEGTDDGQGTIAGEITAGEQGNASGAGSPDQQDMSAAHPAGEADENVSSTNALAQRLQVPERYTASDSEGIYELECDARVIVPDVAKVSVWKVSQREFSQAFIDRVTEVFFGDKSVYNGDTYFTTTKEEALAQLTMMKAWQAEGSHPYGLYSSFLMENEEDEEGDASDTAGLPTLQEQIDSWEKIYTDAPEERGRYEITPTFGASYYSDNAGEREYYEDSFRGAVEMEDGAVFSYNMSSIGSAPMDLSIERKRGTVWNGIQNWYMPEENDDNSDLPPREELVAMTGITQEEARTLADSYMEKLGLSEEFSAKAVNLVIYKVAEDLEGMSRHLDSAGWRVDYTRDVDGFPVTDEEDPGGSLESMEDMTTETWNYEHVEFVVNGEGLQEAHIMNLYDVGEQQVENVQMIPFPEAAGIFEQMLRIQNADLNYDTFVGYKVDRAELGYMRIYDPGTDSRSGYLVPVWDFFGQQTHEYNYDGEVGRYTVDRPQYSFLTVNAADGTVIDRGLGY